MNPLAIPQEYYAKEGIMSLMGIGYTAALVVLGLGGFNMITARGSDRLPAIAILVGGALATFGYIKASDLDYTES